ncbi:PEP-CTERM motif protein [Maioricimonas rarisocia]|uniref:PEP-CTERM motif protein n=1 Tax=Maioricimonas rarisocia TaxID=2528026 RepID=A0A517ZA71_9PLAN|nr:PEP-CTERM sorting domain-containing protein [Maioricimonas rarisocia]QDU39330.1 PEP-CTERM motif protein [Maioricimonas rarisocia]
MLVSHWRTLSVTSLTTVALLLAAPQLEAGLVIVEPDDFAAGTNISNAFAGVTLSAVGTQTGGVDVFSVAGPHASTGSFVFGHDPTVLDPFDWTRLFDYAQLKATFYKPTDFVSIDIVGLNSTSSFFSGRLQAFNSSGTSLEIASANALLFAGDVKTIAIHRPQQDIAYVLASGDTDFNSLDNLQFSAVPEPSSLALLGIGCAAIAVRRRRRR